jgi:hypothetical protein
MELTKIQKTRVSVCQQTMRNLGKEYTFDEIVDLCFRCGLTDFERFVEYSNDDYRKG